MDNVRTKKEILLGQKEDMIIQAISELPEKDATDIHFIGALKRLADKKEKIFIDEELLYRQLSDEYCQVILHPATA